MAWGQDADLVPFPAQRMNMHDVLFCFDFHVNNITRGICLDQQILGNDKRTSPQQSYQNTLQNKLHVCQTRIRNTSQISGLCGPI